MVLIKYSYRAVGEVLRPQTLPGNLHTKGALRKRRGPYGQRVRLSVLGGLFLCLSPTASIHKKEKAMDCQDINFDHHQHYLNTRRMARERAAERDAQSKPRKRMTDLEFNKLLNEALAELGLSVKLVTESPYMPNTCVIMMPKSTRKES